MPTMTETGDWAKAARILGTLPERVEKAFQQAVLQEAHFFRKKILEEFDRGGPEGGAWAPHSPWTIAIRKLLGNLKSKLLMQSGDMRNALGVVPIPGGGAFVGFRRTASTKSKIGIVNLADIHERGREFTVRLTPQMRALLFAAMAKSGQRRKAQPGPKRPGGNSGAVLRIRIPPRPMLSPVVSRYGQPAAVEASILNRMAILLGGDVGKPEGAPRE